MSVEVSGSFGDFCLRIECPSRFQSPRVHVGEASHELRRKSSHSLQRDRVSSPTPWSRERRLIVHWPEAEVREILWSSELSRESQVMGLFLVCAAVCWHVSVPWAAVLVCVLILDWLELVLAGGTCTAHRRTLALASFLKFHKHEVIWIKRAAISILDSDSLFRLWANFSRCTAPILIVKVCGSSKTSNVLAVPGGNFLQNFTKF